MLQKATLSISTLIIDGKPLYDKEMFDAGIWHVKDLSDQNKRIIQIAHWKFRGLLNLKYRLWRTMLNIIKNIYKGQNEKDRNDFKYLTIKYKNIECLDLLTCDTKYVYDTLIRHQNVYSKASAKYC